MRKWYLIRTKPRSEEIAGSYLAGKAIETYLPLMEQMTVRKGAMNKALKPLFPSYVFARFELNSDFALVNWAHGVREIVSFGGNILPVPDYIIEAIKNRAEGGAVIKKARRFSKGDRVAIAAGPLKDFIGVFDHWVSASERVCILLNSIGYGPRVEVHYSLAEHI